MLQQLAQSSGGPQMIPMGMLPPGFPIPNGQGQNSTNLSQQSQSQQGPSGSQGINPMGLQSPGLGQMGGQNFNDMMRQQQAIQ